MAIFRSLWIWIAIAALFAVWLPSMALVRLFDRDPLRRRTARLFRGLGRAISRVNPWRLHISGAERVRPESRFVIVSNHQSLADIPLITHIRVDAKWLAKAELFRLPVTGWMLRWAGDIAVERGDRRKAAQALLAGARALKQGLSVVFFPEGSRSRDGSVQAFNDGPFQLAIREQVPVLPLVVEGSGDALPRHTWIFRGTQDIYLRVLEPEPVGGLTTAQAGELRDRVRDRIVSELQSLRNRQDAK